MGGPFWARRHSGAWTVPKGECRGDEDGQTAACREFQEELGLPVPDGPLIDLGMITQRGGKAVQVWAVEGDLDPARMVPGTFELEWPPHSGRTQQFPELDRAAWVALGAAVPLLVSGQQEFLRRLAALAPPAES